MHGLGYNKQCFFFFPPRPKKERSGETREEKKGGKKKRRGDGKAKGPTINYLSCLSFIVSVLQINHCMNDTKEDSNAHPHMKKISIKK